MPKPPFLAVRALPLIVGGLALSGCVAHVRTEDAALTMPWPAAPPGLDAHIKASGDDPTASGDILKGASPEDQAAARAAVSRALDSDNTSRPE